MPALRWANAPTMPESMHPTIRPASSSDASLIFALIGEIAAYERLSDEVDASEEGVAAALFGAHPRVFCDIAEWDGRPAGFALWCYNFSTFRGRHGIYLEDLFVRPAFRRNGIATALFRCLARRCQDENLARLEWAVLNWNEPALRFYASLGATAMDGWTTERVTGEALAQLGGDP